MSDSISFPQKALTVIRLGFAIKASSINHVCAFFDHNIKCKDHIGVFLACPVADMRMNTRYMIRYESENQLFLTITFL